MYDLQPFYPSVNQVSGEAGTGDTGAASNRVAGSSKHAYL